jgi:maleamate amidohydrolase
MTSTLKNDTEVARKIYAERGFQHRVGYGKRPAIVNVDLANAWTREGSPFACNNMNQVIANVLELLEIGRQKKIPIFYSTVAYEDIQECSFWVNKIPALKELKVGSLEVEIDPRLKKQEGEYVIVKKHGSVFDGTHLDSMLTALGVDTLIITGVTACCCVRHTAEDAIARGYRPIIPLGTVSDRIPGALEWNLFDIDAKFGDVEPLEKVKEYLEKLA